MAGSDANLTAGMDGPTDRIFDNNVYGPPRSLTSRRLPGIDDPFGPGPATSKSGRARNSSTRTKAHKILNDRPRPSTFAGVATNLVSPVENGGMWEHNFGEPGDTSDALAPSRPAASVRSSRSVNSFRPNYDRYRERHDPAAQPAPRRTRRIHADKDDRARAATGFDGPSQGRNTASFSAYGANRTHWTPPETATIMEVPQSQALVAGNTLNARTPAFVPRKTHEKASSASTEQSSNKEEPETSSVTVPRQEKQHGHAQDDDHMETNDHSLQMNGPSLEANNSKLALVVHKDSYAKVLATSDHCETSISPSAAQVGKAQCSAPDAREHVGHAGIPDLKCIGEVCRTTYTVPILGSESMPLLDLQQFPQYESLKRQISNHLPEHLHHIPPPTYAFSQKTAGFCPTASMTGAAAKPPRTMNSVLPNNMHPIKPFVEAFEVEMGQGRTSSEFGTEDMPKAQCDILQESAPFASRWAWFANRQLSAHGDDIENLELRTVNQQLSGQYDHRIHAGCWLRDDQGGMFGYHEKDKLLRAKLAYIDDWMIHQFVNTLAQPYEWDMTIKGFRSGELPCSGLAFDYQEFPPDLGYDPIAFNYGPIDWEAIPAPRLNQPSYVQHTIFNQTSQGSMDLEMAKIAARSHSHLESMKLKKQVFAQRQIILGDKTKARTLIDTSYRSSVDDYFGVHGKVYIRPISFKVDVRAMLRIYNWHVSRTIDVPETESLTMKELLKSIDASAREGYPCLVAVLRADPGDPPIARHLDFTEEGTDSDEPNEHVVGFTMCKAWSTIGTHAFQDIASLSVFVSPQYVGRKIATNLLDRAIGCIDRDYPSKQGAQIRVPPTGPAWNRGWREPQTICMRWFFEDMAAPQNIGRKTYLEDHFGFVETGQLLNALSKDGNRSRYSMITMQREANRLPQDDLGDDQGPINGWQCPNGEFHAAYL